MAELNEHTDEHQFSLHAAALILGISYPTMLRHCTNNHIRHIPKGGRKVVTCEELRRYVKEGNFKLDTPGAKVSSPRTEHIADLIRDEPGGGINIDQLSPELRAKLSCNPHKE